MGKRILKIEPIPREVVEGVLLVALDDKNKVAVLLDEDDLEMLISDLGLSHGAFGFTDKQKVFREDLIKLRDITFGEAK